MIKSSAASMPLESAIQICLLLPFGFCQGTADAIRRCLWVLEEYPVSEFLVLPGHHLYRMDYQKLIESHRNSQADISIVALNSIRDQDPGFGLLKVNSINEVIESSVKLGKEPLTFPSVSYFPPESSFYLFCFCASNGSLSQKVQVESPRKSDETAYRKLSSMGIYLVNRDIIAKLLNDYFPDANDFGNEVITGAISTGMKVKLTILCFPSFLTFLT